MAPAVASLWAQPSSPPPFCHQRRCPDSPVCPTKWHPSTAANMPRAERPRKAAAAPVQSWPARATPRQEHGAGGAGGAAMLALPLGLGGQGSGREGAA